MIYTRDQFIEHWKLIRVDLKILLVPEFFEGKHKPMQWFINVPTTQEPLYAWAKENLQGQLFCYSSSAFSEWWGVEHYADAVMFKMRFG
jgi:hypothetical protein